VVGDFRTHDGSQRRHCFLAVSRADSSFTCISRSWCVYMVIKAPPDCFSGRHTTAWAGSQTRENDARALGYLSTAEAEVHGKLGFFRICLMVAPARRRPRGLIPGAFRRVCVGARQPRSPPRSTPPSACHRRRHWPPCVLRPSPNAGLLLAATSAGRDIRTRRSQ
jgi:hypothetical protein